MSNDISGPATPENEHLGENDVVIHIYTKFGDIRRIKYATREDVNDKVAIIRQALSILEVECMRARILGD